jgi:hypothetical protein
MTLFINLFTKDLQHNTSINQKSPSKNRYIYKLDEGVAMIRAMYTGLPAMHTTHAQTTEVAAAVFVEPIFMKE